MIYFLGLLACIPTAKEVALDVQTFDCDTRCWTDETLTVPSEFWDTWADDSACADGGLHLTYGDSCVSLNRFCESAWADDPEVGNATGCCDGDIAVDELGTAPLCGGVTER